MSATFRPDHTRPPKSAPAAHLQALFREATSFHQKGQLQLAQSMYETILKSQPNHYQSLHLLGLVALQKGSFQKASELIERAIAVFPGNADFYVNLGNARRCLKQSEAAIYNYERAIAIKPDHAQAYCNLGVTLQGAGNFAGALEAYQQAISISPVYIEAYLNCGLALHMLRRLEEALRCYERAIAIAPSYAELHFVSGNVLMELQRIEAAIGCYDKAIALRPNHAQTYFNRGFALQQLGQFKLSLDSYNNAIRVHSGYAEAHCNRGVVLIELQQLDAAVDSCDRAIALKPDYAEAHFNRGNALLGGKRFDEALLSYEKALAINPTYVKALANRGFALHCLRQLDAALISYDKAIEIYPEFAEAYSNRGLVLHELRRMADALTSYDKAIAADPSYVTAYFYKSLTYLLCGTFDQGWALYEWRLKTENSKEVRRSFHQPVWLGEDSLTGKTVLIHSEQGYGDTIQFCRYASKVASLGARVILEIPEPLIGLLSSLDKKVELVERGKPLPTFEYHCSLLSLPFAFKTDDSSIPAKESYLSCDRSRVSEWERRLGAKTKPRVGLAWSGNPEHVNDHSRSIALAELIAHLPDSVDYVSLQKNVRTSDVSTLLSCENIRHFGDSLVDFSDTAALCELMDLIISVDTSVAHLGGALGKPTWVLLPHVPDWRWQLDRDDSPWYPSVKLFRQASDRGWQSVLVQLHLNLAKIFGPN